MDAFAAFQTFETQFDYENSDVAWLTDLVVKEDMATIDGLAQRTDIVARPVYPYTETAESFSKDVDYYCSLYTLDASQGRAAVLYFFSVLTSQTASLAGDVSDDDIRTYLESVGVYYPDVLSDEELLAARALYIAMATGTFSAVTSGASLDEVLIDFTASMTGLNSEEVREWMPDASVLSFDDYFLASSKLALWTSGYDVDANTDEETVARYISYMALEKVGISSDSSLSVEEMKYKYMAAMLSVKYGVPVDSENLKAALASGTEAAYVLQLIGKAHSLAMRDGEYTLDSAFAAVAENTDIFDIEPGEFYADVTDYEVTLANRRSSIWIYPTAYVTNNSSYTVTITVNGKVIRNNFYNEVEIDPSLEEQILVINVVSSSVSTSSEFSYDLKVIQGEKEEQPIEGDEPGTDDPGAPEEHKNAYLSSDSFVREVLAEAGMESYITAILDTTLTPVLALAPVVRNTISFVAPSFDYGNIDVGLKAFSADTDDAGDNKYVSVLDELSGISDSSIKGIGGLDIGGTLSSLGDVMDLITF